MSLEQLLFCPSWWENLERTNRTLDKTLNPGVSPEILIPKILQMYDLLSHKTDLKSPMEYYRPWGEFLRKDEGGTSIVVADKDKFRVNLDVQEFQSDEISVKVVDRFVVVEASHEEKEDEHGWISRRFTRKYIIPEQCDIDQVSSELSSDGVLSIIVPRKEKFASGNERVINIERTGKSSVCDMQNEENEAKEKEKEKEKEGEKEEEKEEEQEEEEEAE
ncbi:protein lethal(2)essential for life-like [Frieseomelitta varia]|uniref:protein lethal(2)essential for life-like n=1 Tax=Frieseomelitta varia TaxID=561572 RepID=UPI001CB691DD|nr:protein lethal(2)essential for life-like [Frieseomelitta varia]